MSTDKFELKIIALHKLKRCRFQPRRNFNTESLDELALSIQSSGIIQPIVVRPLGQEFEIIAGERRWRAAQKARLHEVPCLIRSYSDKEAMVVTTIENVNRIDLNPIEEAHSYQQLCEQLGYSHEEVAAIVGKSRVKITNSLRLLKLASSVQKLLEQSQLSEGHGKILAGLPESQQMALAEQAIRGNWNVRRIEVEAKKYTEKQISSSQAKCTDTKDLHIQQLESSLADFIGCPVKLSLENPSKGKITIEFHHFDILEGLLEKLGFNFDSF